MWTYLTCPTCGLNYREPCEVDELPIVGEFCECWCGAYFYQPDPSLWIRTVLGARMQTEFSDVLRFREATGLELATAIRRSYHADDGGVDADVLNHWRLLREEITELANAIAQDDPVAVADGIVDSIVILMGFYAAMFPPRTWWAVWEAISESNIAKAGGDRDEHGKLQKPEGWQPPDLRRFLR